MKDLETLSREGQMKEFHKVIKDITHIGKRTTIVQELVVEDQIISDRNEIDALITDYLTEIYKQNH